MTAAAAPHAQQRIQDAAGRLKVFPLPSVVLMPGTAVPLHIFEPRYRALVRDSLATDKVLALAQLQPGWEGSYQGRPALQPVCCAGVVAWHEELPDGRYNLLLEGLCRFRIEAEHRPERLYREVLGEPLPDAAFDGPEVEELRRAVLELTGRLPAPADEALAQVAARTSGGGLADAVASALVTEVPRRYQLLCELDVRRRLRAVLGDAAELMAQLSPASPQGPLN